MRFPSGENSWRLAVRTVFLVVFAAGTTIFGIAYYKSHRQLDIKSITRDVGRHTPDSEVCGTRQVATGTVVSVNPEHQWYALEDQTGTMRVRYPNSAPSIGQPIRVEGLLLCTLKSDTSSLVDHVELHEEKRSIQNLSK